MENSLLNYFNYLRDTSKNLISSGDLYRCLLPKYSKKIKNSVFETDINFLANGKALKSEDSSKYFLSYLSQIKKEANKQVYIGVGYIIGNTNKRIFGSIVNIPVIFDSNEFISGEVSFSLDYQNISLNYDLIASILPDYFSSEYDDTANDILSLLTDFEANVKNTNIGNISLLIRNLIEDFYAANNNIFIEKFIHDKNHDELINYKNKDAILNQKKLFYKEDKYHFFIAEIPDAISTWENLKSFCYDIKDKSFDSNVLLEFFGNVFDDVTPKEVNSSEVDYSDFIRDYLPLTLSKNQVVALNNGFNSNISYIQGPPGTGKSHTISAILLSAAMIDKKVLVVAQKSQALDVVKSKIDEFYDQSIKVPFIYFNKEDKGSLKTNILDLANKNISKDFDSVAISKQIKDIELNMKKIRELIQSKSVLLEKTLIEYAKFFNQNESFIKKIHNLLENPIYDKKLKDNIIPLNTSNEQFIDSIKNIENKYFELEYLTKLDEISLRRHEQKFNSFFKSEVDFIDLFKNRLLVNFVENWFLVLSEYGANEKIKNKLSDNQFIKTINFDLSNLKLELENNKKSLFALFNKKKLYENIMSPKTNSEVQKFAKMLHWNRGDKVLEKMRQIDYSQVFKAFPIWLSEIRNIGEVLPNVSELFDLVIVDESSQVNLAEILPIFYRAKNICVVGDHKQLGLNASGLTFSLSKKFDKVIWNKYKPNGFDFDTANMRNLTITKASILDLLRSEENKKTFKYVMLDEHYRSLPGLTAFNNKEFYDSELKIMTEIPNKTLVQCFSAIRVPGEKESKINKKEAEEVINAIKYIIGKKMPTELREKYEEEVRLNKFVPSVPTIGIISAVRDQVDYIKDLLETFSEDDFSLHRLSCGTPEEFQGDEFDIVILSTTTDESSKNNGHYSNENRFNVASSRAKYFTLFIYSDVSKIPMYDRYLQHFGVYGQRQRDPENILNWEYEQDNNQHAFISNIDIKIKDILEDISNENQLMLFNNVKSCGQEIKFVIFNKKNDKFIGINPIGLLNNNEIENNYGVKIIDQVNLLKKAGWDIIMPTYHSWYQSGNLVDNEKEKVRLKQEIIAKIV